MDGCHFKIYLHCYNGNTFCSFYNEVFKYSSNFVHYAVGSLVGLQFYEIWPQWLFFFLLWGSLTVLSRETSNFKSFSSTSWMLWLQVCVTTSNPNYFSNSLLLYMFSFISGNWSFKLVLKFLYLSHLFFFLYNCLRYIHLSSFSLLLPVLVYACVWCQVFSVILQLPEMKYLTELEVFQSD